MNWLDVLLGGILAVSVTFGLLKGFIRLGIGLLATVLAFLAASWFYEPAGEWALPYTSSRSVAHFVGYVTVFVGVIFVGAIVSRLLAKFFKWIGLSWADRLGGAVLGLIRGALIGIVIILMISSFLPGDPPLAIVESRIAPYLLESANWLSATTSPEMKEQFRQTYEKVQKAWVEPVTRQLRRKE